MLDQGSIDAREMMKMLKDVYGNKYKQSTLAQKVLHKIEALQQNVSITPEVFSNFCRKHHALLFPAFRLQLDLQSAVLGTLFWERLTGKRMRLAGGKRTSIKELMAAHLNDEVFVDLAAAEKAGHLRAVSLKRMRVFSRLSYFNSTLQLNCSLFCDLSLSSLSLSDSGEVRTRS